MTEAQTGWRRVAADARATWKKGLAFLVLACIVGYLAGQYVAAPLAEALTK